MSTITPITLKTILLVSFFGLTIFFYSLASSVICTSMDRLSTQPDCFLFYMLVDSDQCLSTLLLVHLMCCCVLTVIFYVFSKPNMCPFIRSTRHFSGTGSRDVAMQGSSSHARGLRHQPHAGNCRSRLGPDTSSRTQQLNCSRGHTSEMECAHAETTTNAYRQVCRCVCFVIKGLSETG